MFNECSNKYNISAAYIGCAWQSDLSNTTKSSLSLSLFQMEDCQTAVPTEYVGN